MAAPDARRVIVLRPNLDADGFPLSPDKCVDCEAGEAAKPLHAL